MAGPLLRGGRLSAPSQLLYERFEGIVSEAWREQELEQEQEGFIIGKPSVLLAGAEAVEEEGAFDVGEYRSMLTARELGQCVLHYPVITSTQTLLLEKFAGVQNGLVCVADRQCVGKGRGSNEWSSPAGSLSFSFKMGYSDGRILPFVQYLVSIAVIRALNDQAGPEADRVAPPEVFIKWPNDIYASSEHMSDKLKVGGILCQSGYSGGQYDVVVGIGLNVANEEPTTCLNAVLRAATGRQDIHMSREAFLARFFAHFEEMNAVFLERGFMRPFLSEYTDMWLHTDQVVRVANDSEDTRDSGDRPQSGSQLRIIGLAESGGLKAVDEAGQTFELYPDGNRLDFFAGLVKRKI